jgi:transcription antitermination factor NusG
MNWYLIIAKPGTELRTFTRLQNLGFDLAMFFIRRKTLRGGKIIDKFSPAFSFYIFIRARGQWREVLDVEGVFGFVKFAGTYAVIGDRVIQSLIAVTQRTIAVGKYLLAEKPQTSKFKFAEPIQILGSGFAMGRKGLFERGDGPYHAIVLIEAFGRFVPVRVKEGDLISLMPSQALTTPQSRRKNKKLQRRSGRWEATAGREFLSTARDSAAA